MSVNYFGGVNASNNGRIHVHQLFEGCRPPKNLEGSMSVNDSGGVDPPNN